jgi:hypothetical protein
VGDFALNASFRSIPEPSQWIAPNVQPAATKSSRIGSAALTIAGLSPSGTSLYMGSPQNYHAMTFSTRAAGLSAAMLASVILEGDPGRFAPCPCLLGGISPFPSGRRQLFTDLCKRRHGNNVGFRKKVLFLADHPPRSYS